MSPAPAGCETLPVHFCGFGNVVEHKRWITISGRQRGEPIERDNFVIFESVPLDRMLALLYLRRTLSQRDWDSYLDVYGIPSLFMVGTGGLLTMLATPALLGSAWAILPTLLVPPKLLLEPGCMMGPNTSLKKSG